MCGQGHQVDLHFVHVDRDLAGALRRIDVQDDAAFAGHLADRADILDDADFVVDVHHRHQHSVVAQRGFQFGQVEQAVRLRRQVSHLKAFPLQLPTGVQHCLVFGLDGDDVLAFLLVEMGGALDRQVVRLGAAAGPDDFARIRADQGRDLLARLVDRLLGMPAEAVRARGRVAEFAVRRQELAHLVRHPGIHRRGRGIVQVDGKIDVAHSTASCPSMTGLAGNP